MTDEKKNLLHVKGTWYTESKGDPRWNANGILHAYGSFDFEMPPEVKDFLARKQVELGEETPRDLTWSYRKD